jgi:hypothetical protein
LRAWISAAPITTPRLPLTTRANLSAAVFGATEQSRKRTEADLWVSRTARSLRVDVDAFLLVLHGTLLRMKVHELLSTRARTPGENCGKGERSRNRMPTRRVGIRSIPQPPRPAKLSEDRALAQSPTSSGCCGHQSRSPAWLQAYLSARPEPSRVTRDHLPQPLHPGACALKKELLQHLRRTRGMRRSRHYTQKTTDSHGRIADAVSISERPAAVEIGRCPVIGRRPVVRRVAAARSPRWSSGRRDT